MVRKTALASPRPWLCLPSGRVSFAAIAGPTPPRAPSPCSPVRRQLQTRPSPPPPQSAPAPVRRRPVRRPPQLHLASAALTTLRRRNDAPSIRPRAGCGPGPGPSGPARRPAHRQEGVAVAVPRQAQGPARGARALHPLVPPRRRRPRRRRSRSPGSSWGVRTPSASSPSRCDLELAGVARSISSGDLIGRTTDAVDEHPGTTI
jgi:hypothetical protein